jgi:ATP-dependent Lhr-like helicase
MSKVYEAFLHKYNGYTGIQKVAMPIVESGSNCLIIAPTGAGKTEAAVLPLLDALQKNGDNAGIRLVYITPLRALNRDMIRRLEELCKSVDITIAVRHGDTTKSERSRQARRAPMFLITTPETLQSILPTKTLGVALKNVKAVVVDEIHELYYNKRGAQLSLALERLEEKAPGFQRIGISATVGDVELVRRFLCNNRRCEVAMTEGNKKIEIDIEIPEGYRDGLKGMKEKFGLDDSSMARLDLISERISSSKSTLIFANTRQVVEALGSRLLYLNGVLPFGGIGVHHSSLDRDERMAIENSFRNGTLRSIIATSSLELGIDIGKTDLVIQYGSPRQALRLIQRVGRSGHTQAGVSKGLIIPTNIVEAIESAAICQQVLEGRLERFEMQTGAMDVLANQVCGIALDKGSLGIDALHGIVSRASPYSELNLEQLKLLLEFMGRQGMIGFDGGVITSGPRTRMYYYDHLSVIPDTRRFLVKNVVENRTISTLDERFVANEVEEGSVFITKGLPWKVLSIDKEVISVEPSVELEAAVPDWVGEDIPVTHRTAQTVLELLGRAGDSGPCLDRKTQGQIERFKELQKRCFLPSKDAMFIEVLEDYKVIYTGLGTKANEALARLLASVFSARMGRSVNVKMSPYLIFLELPRQVDVEHVLMSLKPELLEKELERTMASTELFRYHFVVVAKLFGIIDRDAALSRSLSRRLVSVMENTPVYSETLRVLMKNYLDVGTLRDFLKELHSGKVKIASAYSDSPSPFTRAVLGAAYYTKELIAPLTPNSELIGSFSRFILSKGIKLLCTYCGFSFTRKLDEIKGMERILCPSCGSPMLSVYDDDYKKSVDKARKGGRLRGKELESMKEAIRYASLFSSYGGKAAIALSVYGVGYRTAARTLMMLKHDEHSFFIDLLEAQRNFIRTKKYWSV